MVDPGIRNKNALGRRPLAWWLVAAALLFGLALGRWSGGGSPAAAAKPDRAATATRAAELNELDDLRTKVAQPVVCTPAPTEPPSPTPSPEPTATRVPAAQTGATLPYGTDFAVTVESVQLVPAPDGAAVEGRLVKVIVSIANRTDRPRLPPFREWRLVDAAGTRYRVADALTNDVGTRGYGAAVTANTVERVELVFDVDPTTGDAFTLESEQDPTFRVSVALQVRG